MSLENRYNSVKTRLLKSKSKSQVTQNVDLLAVSKKHSAGKIRQLYQLGQRMFGESYLQESLEKMQALDDLAIEWHFIGPIQSNKTRLIAENFSWVQSVDSLKLLTRLNKQRKPDLLPLNVLLQLKVGGEQSKRGLQEGELLELLKQHKDFPQLAIRGLMSIPSPQKSEKEQRKQFDYCQKTFLKMNEILAVDTLSIGMSTDLEAAIACGSTMVRVGTDIFGSR